MKAWLALGLVGLGTLACGAQTVKAPAQNTMAPGPAFKTDANPALWQVKGVHGTVYLFGTVHVMKAGVEWETAPVKSALAASSTLYEEIADLSEDSVKAMQPMILEAGMDMQHPLSTKISKDDVALLDKTLKDMGSPVGEQSFEPFKPWLVYLTLSVLPLQKSGYDTSTGIDLTLAKEARDAKKTVNGFETVETQMKLFSGLPEAEQVSLLHQELVDMPTSTDKLDTMVADWTKGDVAKIAALENGELKTKYPALYDKLLVKRNEHFADVIAGLLKDPATGTVFVAIGAGHTWPGRNQ